MINDTHFKKPSRRVAVVGGGASGMSAAWKLLRSDVPVTLYESEPVLGGHCFPVEIPGTGMRVDGGVSDFNGATFVGFRELIEELDLPYHAIGQDASFARPDGSVCWYVRDGVPHFIDGVSEPERMLAEIDRFNRNCGEVLDDVRQAGRTAAEYVAENGYGVDFVRCWFVPRAGGCFPMPERHPSTFLIQSIVGFWKIHGLVGGQPAQRFVLDGGMAEWPRAFERKFVERGGDLRLGARVLGITRGPERTRIASVSAAGAHLDDYFDQVIVATNANQVLGLFDDVRHAQSTAFAGLNWQRARVYVHRDASMMPRVREAWGAYNYLLEDEPDGTMARPTITFWPRGLTRDAAVPEDVFVSVNPPRVPGAVIASRFLVHPSTDRQCEVSVERIERIQGLDRTWYAGSYLLAPHVHEQAVQVGLQTARKVIDAIDSEEVAPSPHVVDFLGRIPDFASLDKGLFGDLVWAFVPFTMRAGTVLYRRGDSPDGALLIESGQVKVINGNRFSVTVGANDIVGEMGFLDGGRRTATVTTLTEVRGWKIDCERFAHLVEDPHTQQAASALSHALARKVASRLLNRLHNVNLHLVLEGPTGLLREVLQPCFDLLPTRVPAGGRLLGRGVAAGACRWLLEGTVVARDAFHAPRFTIGPGGAVGLMEIFTRNPAGYDYVAATECCTLDLPLDAFSELARGHRNCASIAFAHHYQALVQWYRESLTKNEPAPPGLATPSVSDRALSGHGHALAH